MDAKDVMKEELVEIKTSRKIKIVLFNVVRYLLVHATQQFLAVNKDIFGSLYAIFNNLLPWKQFLNSLAHQN